MSCFDQGIPCCDVYPFFLYAQVPLRAVQAHCQHLLLDDQHSDDYRHLHDAVHVASEAVVHAYSAVFGASGDHGEERRGGSQETSLRQEGEKLEGIEKVNVSFISTVSWEHRQLWWGGFEVGRTISLHRHVLVDSLEGRTACSLLAVRDEDPF